MSNEPRTESITNIIPLNTNFADSQTIIIKKVEVNENNIIAINLTAENYTNLFNVHTASTSGIVSDHNQLKENFRSFFNIQSNVNLFADDLYTKLITTYSDSIDPNNSISINKRKLRNLCKSDGLIWNSLFADTSTIFKSITDIERNTTICEEIALDFQNAIEQDEYSNGDPELFWQNPVSNDYVMIRLTLNLGDLVSSNNLYDMFIRFKYQSTGTYNYSI